MCDGLGLIHSRAKGGVTTLIMANHGEPLITQMSHLGDVITGLGALAPWRSAPGLRSMTAQEAHGGISHYLMHRYNWIRTHQFNGGLAPAQAEKKLNLVSGIS